MMQKMASAPAVLLLLGAAVVGEAQHGYAGFDRNDYPGDASLAALRQDFSYTGYWLNNPPGEQRNSWVGKRQLLKEHGFGFLVLFNGRTDKEIRRAASKGEGAAGVGTRPAASRIASSSPVPTTASTSGMFFRISSR